MRENEIAREVRRKEKLSKELTRTKGELDESQAEIKSLMVQQQKTKDEHQKLDLQLKEQKVAWTKPLNFTLTFQPKAKTY